MSSEYFFENTWPEERARITALEAALDPGTRQLLTGCGVAAGWRCWEVGAGGGSVAAWLAEHEGVNVLATDIQTSFLEPLAREGLEVQRHDVSIDSLPEDAFDLVHVRWMLFWLSSEARAAALSHIVSRMRPGAWLVAEEPDFITMLEATAVPEPLYSVTVAHIRLIEKINGNVDPRYGNRLLGDLQRCGLAKLSSAGRTHVIRPDDSSTGSAWLRLALERVRQPLIDAGACRDEEFTEALRQLDDPSTVLPFPITMAVRGQRGP